MSKPWIKRPVVMLGLAFNAVYLAYYVFGGTSEAPARPRPRPAPFELTKRSVVHRSPEGVPASVYPAEDLTLIREPGRKLLFSPSYHLAPATAGAPQIIQLRFYSFARAPQYVADRQLRMTTDGRGEYWMSDAVGYSLDVGEDGEVVESLIAQLPSDAFAQMVNGRDLIITVGHEEIALTDGQLISLRNMLRCASGAPCG